MHSFPVICVSWTCWMMDSHLAQCCSLHLKLKHPNSLELIHLCVHGLITQLLRYYTEISLKICTYSRREKEFHMSVTGRSLKQHERYSAVCPCFRALLTDVRGHTSDTITPHRCSQEKSKQFTACSDFFLWLSEIYRAAETPSFCSQGFHVRC